MDQPNWQIEKLRRKKKGKETIQVLTHEACLPPHECLVLSCPVLAQPRIQSLSYEAVHPTSLAFHGRQARHFEEEQQQQLTGFTDKQVGEMVCSKDTVATAILNR